MLVTLVCFVALVIFLFYLGSLKPKGYPPGPKWWPLMGCALELAKIRKEIGHFQDACTFYGKKYGPIVGLKIGIERIVILNSYESAKSMMMNEECDGRQTGIFSEVRTNGKRQGLLLTDGPLWVKQRRFVFQHLRDCGLGKNIMGTMIEEEAMSLVNNLMEQLGSSSMIREDLSKIERTNGNDGIRQLTSQNVGKKTTNLWKSESMKIEEENSKKSIIIDDVYGKADDYYSELRNVSMSSGLVVEMNKFFDVAILNASWKMIAGKRFNKDDERLNHLQDILSALLEESDMVGCLFGYFPILRYIAPVSSGYKNTLETHEKLRLFLSEELENRKETFNPDTQKNLVDEYLKISSSNSNDETFSESQLLAVWMDLYIATSETTTKTLKFCFLYLILNPEIQRKAQEEIDRVIGRNRFPSLSDRTRMIYVNAVGLEALRIFMGRNMTLPHRALKDTTILGHTIPKDTLITVNANGIFMDDSWGDPETFRPERFIDENGNISIPERYIPFGLGKRRCMGEVLGKSSIFIFTAALLQAFNFSVVPGEEKPSTEFTEGATASPLPFRVLMTKRN